jgi:hypothetical protein
LRERIRAGAFSVVVAVRSEHGDVDTLNADMSETDCSHVSPELPVNARRTANR